MLVPNRRTRNLIGELMTEPFEMVLDGSSSMAKPASSLMRTDIKETDKALEITVDLPGIKKKDVSVELKEGYLTISSSTSSEKEEKNEEGTYLRKERFTGKCSRDFYVGEDIMEKDIKAKFENGLLKIDIPRAEKKKPEEKKTVIAIS